MTTLVGDNDSGKSNVLRALNLFFNDETDPGQNLDFNVDYNRSSDANRGKSKRAKEIEISVTLELPSGYRPNNGERVVWRKQWRETGLKDAGDITGLWQAATKRGTIRWEQAELPPRSRVPTLLSKVQYEYVPAIRGADVFRTLRGRMYGVIARTAENEFRKRSSDFQKSIQDQVNTLLKDVQEQLGDQVSLSLPRDLTLIFEQLDFLNEADGVSLDQRGDGIKGRYLPLILKFMLDRLSIEGGQGVMPNTFIWGYEEPENNLEYRRATELAESFRNMVQNDFVQVLLTTHSPVFFNKSSDDPELSKVAYISQSSLEEGSIARDELSILDTLDDRMGVMPIIAPHLKKANQQIEELKKAVADLNAEIEADDDANKPTVFVEGVSDYIVFGKLLEHITNGKALPIKLAEPPVRAGTEYVVNNLLAWQYRTKNLPKADRQKAIGIIDNDCAGSDAKKRFNEQIEAAGKERYVELLMLPDPQWMGDAKNSGFLVPIALEELYPIEYWKNEEVSDWLEARKLHTLLSPPLNENIITGQTDLETVLNRKQWSIVVRRKPVANGKTAWAQWVVDDEPEEVTRSLPELTNLMKEVLRRLS